MRARRRFLLVLTVAALLGLLLRQLLRDQRPAAPGAAQAAHSAFVPQDDPAASAEAARMYLRRHPEEGAAHRALQVGYQQTERLTELPGVYAGLLEVWPGNARLRFEYGKALFLADQHSAAIGTFEAILATQPEHQAARKLLGLTLLESGQPARACELLTSLSQRDAQTERYLGIAFVQSGQHRLGLPLLESAFDERPDLESGLFLARALLGTDQPGRAEAILRALVGGAGEPQLAMRELAALYLRAEGPSEFYRPADAVYFAEQANARGAGCYDILALAYRAQDDPEMACAVAELGASDEAAAQDVRSRCAALLQAWQR